MPSKHKRRRVIKNEEVTEGAFQVKDADQNQQEAKKKNKRNRKKEDGSNRDDGRKNKILHVHIARRPHTCRITAGLGP